MKTKDMPPCEIIYVKSAKGWKWRALDEDTRKQPCKETYELFYECVVAARSRGYKENVKCL
jgi:hypothetical protein